MKLNRFACVFLLLASNVRANPESFDIDPVHTRVAFMVSHAGFSNPIATFSGSTGEIVFDDNDWNASTIQVSVPIATLNLGDTDWQEKILDGTFFDSKKFPTATFVSTRIEKLSDNTGIAHGNMKIRDVSQPISITFTLNALKRHPLNLKKTIGFSATTTLSRKAFGMQAWSNLIGDEVRLMIELEATRGKPNNPLEQDNDASK